MKLERPICHGWTLLLVLVAVAVVDLASAQTPNLLQNGGFETVQKMNVGPDGTCANWQLGAPPLAPTEWSLNTHHSGKLDVVTGAAYEGERCIRITGKDARAPHLYQLHTDLEAGTWYRFSAWVRNGTAQLYVYEYFKNAPMRTFVVAQGTSRDGTWRPVTGLYQPSGDGYAKSGIALSVPAGKAADVDGVSLTRLNLPEADPGAKPYVWENDTTRLSITPTGVLAELVCKETGRDYRPDRAPFPLFTATRNSSQSPVLTVKRDGDLLNLRFLDPEIRAVLRVSARRHHVLFEVVDIQPADVDQFDIEFPVTRLKTVGLAMNGTYDDKFGMCLFGTTVNTCNRPTTRSAAVQGLRSSCYRAHKIVGAAFALVAAPAVQFREAIMEAERENGLPCPMLDGAWARDSDAVRRSYLFAVGVHERDIDTLIEYAKTGGFGTIMILKDSWLANHGHFDVNTASFPEGVPSLKRAVTKIHAAGLHAGVHVFGPSISANDPYITPIPDERLAYVECPPLAEGAGAAATVLTLTAQPEGLPPKLGRSRAFPGYHIRVGNELIRYTEAEVGPPFRFTGCQRGALGTQAAAHAPGARVRGLLSQWGFFLVDPDSTLADELTQNFADVINACDFDLVYFDASDGTNSTYLDGWYYQNRMHLGYYQKLKRDVLYQTSNGTGRNALWHMVPRSASADGHGDIKGYLDQRWTGILGMADNWTKADVGWYYWFKDVRPDQIEYVCAKALGVDGTISLETSREAMDRLTQTRQMFEMIERYESCRRANVFGTDVRAKLCEPKKDFRLFRHDGGWRLSRAAYEEPRLVDQLDGRQNVWTITNPQAHPVDLGAEIVRGKRHVGTAEYNDARALTIETFDSATPYRMDDRNAYEKFVVGGEKVLTPNGPVRKGVSQSFETATGNAKVGPACLVYTATNAGANGGWSGMGRRFDPPLDVAAYAGVGLWIHGDAQAESVRFQFRDVAGRHADWVQPITFSGWRLFTFPLPKNKGFDWAKTEYMLFCLNDLSAKTSVRVMFDDIKMLPKLQKSGTFGNPTLDVNNRRITLPIDLEGGQAVTVIGAEGAKLWPGGMRESRRVDIDTSLFVLRPGLNTVTFGTSNPAQFPGDVSVLLYRMWPLEE